jgi:hypothetical protein
VCPVAHYPRLPVELFRLEERAEGYLLVDPDGLATDQRFPDDAAHSKIAALVLLDQLVAAGGPVPTGELTQLQ